MYHCLDHLHSLGTEMADGASYVHYPLLLQLVQDMVNGY